jgi:hypothetical protein
MMFCKVQMYIIIFQQGALNLHTKDKIVQFLNIEKTNRPEVLIFHCEFSSERGPKL